MHDDIPDVSHLHRFDGVRLLAEARHIFMHEYYQRFLPEIEKALTLSKQREHYKDPGKHLDLQLTLLERLQKAEEASSKANSQARKQGNEALAQQSKRHKYISKAYKEIADGIAWRTLSYERFPMRILSQGRHAGHTWGKDSGQSQELRHARRLADNNVFVLLNDITNCLRVGDLTSLHPGTDHPIQLTEIKRKELITPESITLKVQKQRALDVQEERLLQAQRALDNRVMPLLSSDVPVVSIPLLNHDALASVGAVMKQAMQKGVAGRLVTPYMYVEAIDLSILTNLKLVEAESAIISLRAGAPANLQPITRLSSYDRLMAAAAGEVIRSSPPLTVYPLPIKIIAKLITGELFLNTTIYREPLQEAFRALGWQLEVNQQALDAYRPDPNADYAKEFSGRTFMPFDGQPHSGLFTLFHPPTGFLMEVGDQIAQMSTEFITARYIADMATAMEAVALRQWPNTAMMCPDAQDKGRWD